MHGRAAREVIGRLALLVLGLLLSLLVLEVVLQTAAAYVRATRRRPSLSGLATGRRILSLGDSNTYGLHLPDRAQAYPGVLGRLWNERHPDDPVEVLNMGYPGNSSSQVLRHLPEMLAAAQPDLVTVMVGVNDFWTEPEPLADERPSPASVLWRFSRVYRLLYMLARSGGRNDVEVVVDQAAPDGSAQRTVRYRWMEFRQVRVPAARPVEHWAESLAQNLAAIVAKVREARVEVVLLTYPSSYSAYGAVDETMRRVAADTNTPLVDLASRFAPICPQPTCPAFLFGDLHPNAIGHLVAGSIVADWLASRQH